MTLKLLKHSHFVTKRETVCSIFLRASTLLCFTLSLPAVNSSFNGFLRIELGVRSILDGYMNEINTKTTHFPTGISLILSKTECKFESATGYFIFSTHSIHGSQLLCMSFFADAVSWETCTHLTGPTLWTQRTCVCVFTRLSHALLVWLNRLLCPSSRNEPPPWCFCKENTMWMSNNQPGCWTGHDVLEIKGLQLPVNVIHVNMLRFLYVSPLICWHQNVLIINKYSTNLKCTCVCF